MIRLILFIALLASAGVAGGERIEFHRDIRPILADRCFRCHGPNEKDRKSHLRLDQAEGEEGAYRTHKGTTALKPRNLEDSELWYRITTENQDDAMPPAESHKKALSGAEKQRFKQWILEGAQYQDFWAFIPPQPSPPPQVKDASWREGTIDPRVMAHLEKKRLKPKGEADKRTLIRRLTFDLTGLPPSLKEIEAFLEDSSAGAYVALVDRLLNKQSYGEHMARYWADLVRLADTNGMHKDFPRDFSTYRSWLIRAFNDNLRFDEFVKYQVAGDLYPEASRDQMIASGFNRLHLIIDRGTALPEESHHKNVLDRVAAFGTTFLGLTLQCAQCHDHKYDPISQKEYYQLYAFFNNFDGEPETGKVDKGWRQAPFIMLTTPEQDETLAALRADEDAASAEVKKMRAAEKQAQTWPKLEKASVPWIWNDKDLNSKTVEFSKTLTLKQKPEWALVRYASMGEVEVTVNGKTLGRAFAWDRGLKVELSALLKPGDNQIHARAKGARGFAFELQYKVAGQEFTLASGPAWQARGDKSDKGEPWQPALEVHNAKHKEGWSDRTKSPKIMDLEAQLAQAKKSRDNLLGKIPAAMVMRDRAKPKRTHVLIRGAYDAPGEQVQRNTPAFLPALKKKEGFYTRMDLAEWLVAEDHPLTARVAVNRFWQQFFGVGLVKTSEDFGAQGEWPSHPELLDALSFGFMESGWNVKKLVRTIVLSKTYRQISDGTPEEFLRDPENRDLARGSRYRMDAEMIRDQILFLSGRLNTTMYGKSVKPPQPPGLWKAVSMAAPLTYVPDTGDKIYRRSFYTYWRRGMPPPQMTIMNAPSREFCLARRERTNTPLQALLLMNEPEFFKAAKACAENTLKEAQGDPSRGLSLLYEKVTSHRPDQERLRLLEDTLEGFRELYRNDRALTESLVPELKKADLEPGANLAAWTMVTHGLFNLELAKVKR